MQKWSSFSHCHTNFYPAPYVKCMMETRLLQTTNLILRRPRTAFIATFFSLLNIKNGVRGGDASPHPHTVQCYRVGCPIYSQIPARASQLKNFTLECGTIKCTDVESAVIFLIYCTVSKLYAFAIRLHRKKTRKNENTEPCLVTS